MRLGCGMRGRDQNFHVAPTESCDNRNSRIMREISVLYRNIASLRHKIGDREQETNLNTGSLCRTKQDKLCVNLELGTFGVGADGCVDVLMASSMTGVS